jgi:hypothetical protein
VLFLMSDLARAVTGEILHVDGGFHAIGAAGEPPAEAEEASSGDDAESSVRNGAGDEEPASAERSS